MTWREAKDAMAMFGELRSTRPQLLIDIAAAVKHCPDGVAASGPVLEYGGQKHGAIGGAEKWAPFDHLEHAMDHLRAAMADPMSVDAETGRLNAAHAKARIELFLQAVVGAR